MTFNQTRRNPCHAIRTLALLVAFAGLALLSSTALRAETIVAPNSLAATEGNSNNGFPFFLPDFSNPPNAPIQTNSQRTQQVYASSQFAALGGPRLITELSFRPDGQFGGAFSKLSDLQINLSTTAKNPDGLSATFAQNTGLDETLVFNGTLTLSSSNLRPQRRTKTIRYCHSFDDAVSLRPHSRQSVAGHPQPSGKRSFQQSCT